MHAQEAVRVRSRHVKSDPVAASEVRVAAGEAASTGIPLPVLAIPAVGIELGVLAVASAETPAGRIGWRVRDEYAHS